MSWNQLQDARKQKGGGLYIRLGDGEKVVGCFRGEPYGFYRKFPDTTEYQDYAEGRRFRFKINFVMEEDGEWAARIFEGSKTVSEQLLDVIEKYSQDCLFEIKRSGSGLDDTRYTIMLEKKLSKEDLVKLEAVTIKELGSGRGRKEELPEVEEETPF